MRDLWAHQKAAILKAREIPNLALFFDIGTGKTRTMIEILREEYSKRRALVSTLIVAPISVCPQWRAEIAQWSKIPLDRIFVLTQAGAERIRILTREMEMARPCIVVTNYEAARIPKFHELLLKWGPQICVADEAHRFKDPSSAQAKKFLPLFKGAERRFLLTGTPILNSMLDIFGQYQALDSKIFGTSFWKFKNYYFYDGNAGRPHCNFPDWKPRFGSDKFIAEAIRTTSVQAKKDECLDLPPLLEVKIPVALSVEQRKAYDSMRKTFVADIRHTQVTAEFAMTKTLRMQQILAGFVAADSTQPATWCEDVPRLIALKELLEKIGGKKVIIWTNWRPSYNVIDKLAQAQGYRTARLTGDESPVEKEASIGSFKSPEGANCLIANPSAGGSGINLQEAGFSIYYSRGYSLEHFCQSQGRNYRGGSEIHKSVIHYHLIAEDTLDEVIAEALLAKKQLGDEILAWAKSHLTYSSESAIGGL